MAGTGVEIELVELFQIANAFERDWAERGLAVEGVEDDAFEEVAESHVVIFGEGFEDFEDSFFHADAGLDALDEQLGIVGHVYQCTMVTSWMQASSLMPRAQAGNRVVDGRLRLSIERSSIALPV